MRASGAIREPGSAVTVPRRLRAPAMAREDPSPNMLVGPSDRAAKEISPCSAPVSVKLVCIIVLRSDGVT